MNLEEARKFVLDNRAKGISCPCCDLFVKEYSRPLNAGMAATLCWLVGHTNGEFVHVNKVAPRLVLRRGGEWSLLQRWGLIKPKPPNPDKDERRSGFWRTTKLGRLFALGRVSVHSRITTFNRGCLGVTGPLVDIHTCLGKHFSYWELMGKSKP